MAKEIPKLSLKKRKRQKRKKIKTLENGFGVILWYKVIFTFKDKLLRY